MKSYCFSMRLRGEDIEDIRKAARLRRTSITQLVREAVTLYVYNDILNTDKDFDGYYDYETMKLKDYENEKIETQKGLCNT